MSGAIAVMDPRNPAVKRLKKELDEIEADDQKHYSVHPLEDNFFEWHFTLEGPSDSVYQDGVYHGVIRFPPDYPFAPPNVSFLSASGRFQTMVKVCLSMTGYHPDQWQPAWGVRTMLIAIRDYFTTDDKASIGYLGASEKERREYAQRSRVYCCRVCGYQGPDATNENLTLEYSSNRNYSMGILIMLIAIAVALITFIFK